VIYYTNSSANALNGFELVYSCEDAAFVTAGFTPFNRCFGTCFGSKKHMDMEIPIEKEIVAISICIGNFALRMMKFKLNDGTILSPKEIDGSGCKDEKFYDLTGRLIGFKTKLSHMPL
jgi:hypothetical protein